MTAQNGVVVAVVERRDDPRKEGRITLRYKWLPGEPVSGWAPIAAPIAGTKRGAWLMPEKGDEVLVAFEQGCFDNPYVVGFLWNGSHKPPDNDLQHRVIVTPGGHQLRFEDNDKKKQIIIKTAGNHVLTLTDAENAMKVSIESAKHHLIEIDDVANSITLDGGGRKVVLADGKVAIT